MKLVSGIFLVLLSLGIITATYFPLLKNEIEYQQWHIQIENYPETAITPLYTDFGLVIPKLNINAKVIKDVDPYIPSIYQKALTQGVAHAKGTVLPGQEGNTFIFSHSSENFYQALHYNSIFYLLPKLEIGDKIILYYEDQPYEYTVTSKQIVSPDDTAFLENDTKVKTLTLMTCYPPGLNSQRFIIVAN